MTVSAPVRCSVLADELAEPMIGTVAQRVRWLLVEHDAAWGADAVADLLGADRARELKRAGVRALTVRRRPAGRGPDASGRVMLVDTEERAMAARAMASPDDLPPAAELASMAVADFGAPLDGPLFLVCTNGRRDPCCALHGRLVVAALAPEHGERTFECSHLGGHRFAGNMVCLPDGIVYGRVRAADAPALAAEYVAGRMRPELLRGRSAWPPPAQVAEWDIRTRERITALDALSLEACTVDGEHADVVLRVAGGFTHRVVLRGVRGAPRRISCRADETEQPLHWQVERAAQISGDARG